MGMAAPTYYTAEQVRALPEDGGVRAAYAKGVLPKRRGPLNSMVGGNEFGSPLPQVSDDAGTPFAVTVIPVDDRLAIRA